MHQRLANLSNMGLSFNEAKALRYREFLVLESHSSFKQQQDEIKAEVEYIRSREYGDKKSATEAKHAIKQLRFEAQVLERQFYMRVT